MLSCPMPAFDFDIITPGHGSGGMLTHRLLQSGVFNLFSNDLLEQQHDGASFDIHGKIAFSTDSYVVTPIFFPGGNIGDLAVNGTVNDLAMCGASAKYMSLSFILEEGLRMEELWKIMVSIKEAADKAGVMIVTGDTKVVEKGKADKIYINTSGIGVIHPDANIHHNNIRPGDKIIISGPIATHGITIMSMRKGLEFETALKSDTASLNHTVKKLLDMFGADIKFMRDPTRGGLASVLNEIAGLTKLEFLLYQDAIVLDPQVEAACELLGLDPLHIANEGIFVSIIKKEKAGAYLEALKKDSLGFYAMEIGEVRSENPGKVILQSSIGGKRAVGFLPGEQLPRIC